MPPAPAAKMLEKQLQTRPEPPRFGFSEKTVEEPLVSQIFTVKFDLASAAKLMKNTLGEEGTVQDIRPNSLLVTLPKARLAEVNGLISQLGYKAATQTTVKQAVTVLYTCPKLEQVVPIVKTRLTAAGTVEILAPDKLMITDTHHTLERMETVLKGLQLEPEQRVEKEALVTSVYTAGNRESSELKPVIAARLTPRGSVHEIKPNKLIIRDTTTSLKSLESLLSRLDTKLPQVMIESTTYEVFSDITVDYSAFVTWRGKSSTQPIPSLEISLPSIPGKEDTIGTILGYLREGTGELKMGEVKLLLDFLVSQGKAWIVCRPWITVESGKKAKIATGDLVPYRAYQVVAGTESFVTEYKEALIALEVTPFVKDDGRVTLNIVPEVNTITGYRGPEQLPLISERKAETTVTIESGTTYVMGGLTKEEERQVRRGIPLLMDIPVLGNLFKSLDREKSKTDIYIAITPRLVGYRGGGLAE